jgi:hypothetical protein
VKKGLKLFGALTLVGSLVAGGYYFLFMRSREPQIELYFDDGSMLALPGDSSEAAPFVATAAEILKANPIAG